MGGFAARNGKRKSPETFVVSGLVLGGDKRDRTADLLNAIAPEVLDSMEVMKIVRQNHIKWTFHSPFRFNWYMVLCSVSGTYSGTYSGTKISAKN